MSINLHRYSIMMCNSMCVLRHKVMYLLYPYVNTKNKNLVTRVYHKILKQKVYVSMYVYKYFCLYTNTQHTVSL